MFDTEDIFILLVLIIVIVFVGYNITLDAKIISACKSHGYDRGYCDPFVGCYCMNIEEYEVESFKKEKTWELILSD